MTFIVQVYSLDNIQIWCVCRQLLVPVTIWTSFIFNYISFHAERCKDFKSSLHFFLIAFMKILNIMHTNYFQLDFEFVLEINWIEFFWNCISELFLWVIVTNRERKAIFTPELMTRFLIVVMVIEIETCSPIQLLEIEIPFFRYLSWKSFTFAHGFD